MRFKIIFEDSEDTKKEFTHEELEALLFLGFDPVSAFSYKVTCEYRSRILALRPYRGMERAMEKHDEYTRLCYARDVLVKSIPDLKLVRKFRWDYQYADYGCECEACKKARLIEDFKLLVKKARASDALDFLDEDVARGYLPEDEWSHSDSESSDEEPDDSDRLYPGGPRIMTREEATAVSAQKLSRRKYVQAEFSLSSEPLAREIRNSPSSHSTKAIKEFLEMSKYKSNPCRSLDSKGNTALHYACYFGHHAAATLLLDLFNAKDLLAVKNKDGKRPVEVTDDELVLKVLRDNGEDLPFLSSRDGKNYRLTPGRSLNKGNLPSASDRSSESNSSSDSD